MVDKQFAQAKVTIRNQIVIPTKVREKLGNVEEGDFILFYEEDDRVYIRKGVIQPIGTK